MLITEAYAQSAGAAQGGDMFSLLMPMILVFAIMYFLMIRPQQKKQKHHQAKLAAVKRGDKVITGGGIYGTVRKISDEGKLLVEIAKDVQIEVVNSTLMDVIVKGEPQALAQQEAPKGFLASLFGGGKTQDTATKKDDTSKDTAKKETKSKPSKNKKAEATEETPDEKPVEANKASAESTENEQEKS